MFVKGKSGNPHGRPKGAVNKLSRIRDDWIKSYETTGGVKNWLKLRKSNFDLYMQLGTRMLPREHEAKINGDVALTFRWETDGDEDDSDSVSTSQVPE